MTDPQPPLAGLPRPEADSPSEPLSAANPATLSRQLSGDETMASAKMLLENLDSQIQFAESKAQLILGANAILIGTMTGLSRGMALALFQPTSGIIEQVALVIVGMVFLILFISVYFALSVARPTLRVQTKPSLMFFGSIVQFPEEEFVTRFSAQSRRDVLQSILERTRPHGRVFYPAWRFGDPGLCPGRHPGHRQNTHARTS
jgi:hypothetical protein